MMHFGQSQLETVLVIIAKAQKAIMQVYAKKDVALSYKEDNSPLTMADKASADIITSGLKEHFPDIPIVCEETQAIPFEERRHFDYFWLVDPLDGTKEFIKKIPEFTVNVALVHHAVPVAGIVALPAQDIVYYASRGLGAFKKTPNHQPEAIHAKICIDSKVIIARSRSHKSSEEEKILAYFDDVGFVYSGSAIKFCKVAEGAADLYARAHPSMEWDTAAGECIATVAGAKVCDFAGERITYNKPSLRNGSFCCMSRLETITKRMQQFFNDTKDAQKQNA